MRTQNDNNKMIYFNLKTIERNVFIIPTVKFYRNTRQFKRLRNKKTYPGVIITF